MNKYLLIGLLILSACSKQSVPVAIKPIANSDHVLKDTLAAHKTQIRNHLSHESIGAAGLLNSIPVINSAERITAITSPTPVKLPLLQWNDSTQSWITGINANYSNRINIVILADGYLKTDSLKSLNDAKALILAFKNRAPLSNYFNRNSFYLVFATSQQQGIGEKATTDGCNQPVTINNYFGSFMGFEGLCRYSNYNATTVNNVLAGTMPYYDIPIVLVNTTTYAGGADGSVAQATTSPSSTEIVIHEMGHALAGLGDEYSYGGCGYSPCWNALSTQDTAYARKLWGDTWLPWLPGDGKYIGGNYCPQGLRDSIDCEMNILGQPFCPQCKKRLIYAFHYYTSDIDGFSPILTATKTDSFRIKVLQPLAKTIKIIWSVNGVVKQIGKNTFAPAAGTYSSVSVTTQDTTKWLFKTVAPIGTETWKNIIVTSITPPPPILPAAPLGVTTGNNESVTITCFATTGATHYTFSIQSGPMQVSSVPSTTFTGLIAKTTYSVTVTVTTANGTSAASTPFNFTAP